jgi:hypothetical protein
MAEEREYEVVDKRRVSADAPPAADTAADGAPAEEQATAESEVAGAPETGSGPAEAGAELDAGMGPEGAMPEMDAVGLVSLCISMLHEVAWVKLGLVPSPMTQKIEKDLAQARLAIDCAADLVRQLESQVDPNTRRDLQNLISTLRMNFVQQSQR